MRLLTTLTAVTLCANCAAPIAASSFPVLTTDRYHFAADGHFGEDLQYFWITLDDAYEEVLERENERRLNAVDLVLKQEALDRERERANAAEASQYGVAIPILAGVGGVVIGILCGWGLALGRK